MTRFERFILTMQTLLNNFWQSLQKLATDARANASLGSLVTVVFAIVGVILAAVIGLRVIAALFPTYADSVSEITTAFNTTDWGDQTATDISPIFAMVTGIAGLLGLVGLVFLTMNVYKRG